MVVKLPGPLLKLTIKFPPEDSRFIAETARRYGLSRSAVVRMALDAMRKSPILFLGGVPSGGHGDSDRQ